MKNRHLALLFLIGALVFLGMPRNTLSANFDNDVRDIQWESNFDDSTPGDFGGIFNDSILSTGGYHVAVGLHTDVYDPNNAYVNHFNSLIAIYDGDGNLIDSLELITPDGSKSYFTRVIELSNGTFLAVGLSQIGFIERTGKAVIFDSSLNIISTLNFESDLTDYSSAGFSDVKETPEGILIGGSLIHDPTETTEMASFLFDENLSLLEEFSYGANMRDGEATDLSVVLKLNNTKTVLVGNIDKNYEGNFLLLPFESSQLDASVVVADLPKYEGFVLDAIVNASGNIVALVVLDDGSYRVRQFDSNLNPLADVGITLQQANYTNISIDQNNRYVVSGSLGGKMHYVISDGQTTAVHTYDTDGVIENTYGVGNGALISVGYNTETYFATIMKTIANYTVSFNGGEETLNVPNQVIPNGSTAVKPTNPTSDSASFVGWYSDAQLTTEFDFATPITESKVLYAKWNRTELVLTYQGDIDASIAPSGTITWNNPVQRTNILSYSFQLTVGDAPTITSLGQQLGVEFLGWQLVEGNSSDLLQAGDTITEAMIDIADYANGGNLTLRAVYSRPSYTVTIKDTADSNPKTYTVYHGEKLSTTNHNPLNGSLQFLGYQEANTDNKFSLDSTIVRDITLVGLWSKPSNPELPATGVASDNTMGLNFVLLGAGMLFISNKIRLRKSR